MRRYAVILALTALGRYIAMLSRLSIVPFYPEMMTKFGLTYTGAGALYSSFFVGYALFLIPAGLGADHFPPLRQLAVGFALLSGFGTAIAWAPAFGATLVARGLQGGAIALIFTASLKLVAVRMDRDQRGRAVGIMEMATGMGMMTALSGFPWLSRWVDYRVLLLTVSAVCLIPFLLLPFAGGSKGGSGQAAPTVRVPLGQLLNRDMLFITLTSLMGLFAVNGVLGWLPTHLVDGLHYGKVQAGFLTGTILISQMVGVVPGGLLSDRLGKRLPVVHMGSAMLIAGFLLLLPARGGVLLYAATTLIGLGMAWGIAPLTALTTEHFGPERAGLVGAITVAVAQVGSGLAGVVLGWVLDLTGRFTAVWLIAAGLATLRILTARLIRENPRVPVPKVASGGHV